MHLLTGKPALIACFILCALPVGIMIALVTPPGHSPDEPAHLARAASLLHGAIIGVRRTDTDPNTGKPELITGLQVDTGLLVYGFANTTEINNRPVLTAPDFLAARAEPSNHTLTYNALPNTATYPPTAYLPATAGLALGLALHEPPYICFLLARMFMLAAMLALGIAALTITAYGEALLLAVLLLPMTLFLAATVNQDGVLIGMTCLSGAALTRPGGWSRFLGVGLLALVLCAKQPYAPLLLILLLPLTTPGLRRRARDAVLAALPMLIWTALMAALVIVPFGQPPHHPGPLFLGDRSVIIDHTNPAANLHILLQHPARFFTLPAHTAQIWFGQSLREMVGALGALEIILPDGYYRLWYLCLAIAAAGLTLAPRRTPATPATAFNNFIAVLCSLIACYYLIQISFYLSWSNVGDDIIEGFQGRYLILLLPFLLFAIPALPFRLRLPPLFPALPTIAMGLFDLGYIPIKLVWTYYLH
jgi:hypothetical protein